jgi:DNA topoisomerase-1
MSKGATNGKSLVIVESPAKARTINKYLGDKFVVKASLGHVRDLPERDFGIDLKADFEPTYEIVKSRAKVVSELRKLAQSAPDIFLATDRDREGEAIAWHLAEALALPPNKIRRVIFNEITRAAIAEAFNHPHEIDMDRVNAQQARRILDRIVGYELSPLLWKKIAKGLSAGRVQSVAVRLIVEREREIRAFIPEESWKLFAFAVTDESAAKALAGAWRAFAAEEHTQREIQQWLSEHGALRLDLAELGGVPFRAATVEQAQTALEALGFDVSEVRRSPWDEYKHLGLQQIELHGGLRHAAVGALRVTELSTRRTTTRPPAPFTTAALQQQASTQLRFAASRTMRVAQSLYEGLDLSGEGPVGLITYMRTDSTNLSGESLDAVRKLIRSEFGERYLPDQPNVYGKRNARAQEAHEAIRPTDPARTPESLRGALSDEQRRLYELIWRRFVACQMAPAEWESTSVSAACQTPRGTARFSGSGRKLIFDGFMRVAGVSSDDPILPALREGQALGLLDLEARQAFTSPPARYTEASLVKALEAGGIGRPSTYASIVDTIQDRGYVEQEDRKFYPTALGEVVLDKLVEHFPSIIDVKFTSHMEDELDKVEDAHLDWVHVLREFYEPFHQSLSAAVQGMEPVRSQSSDYRCPSCDAPMVYRWSRTGRFLACSRYPDCKTTTNVNRRGEPLSAQAGEHACQLCQKPMTVRKSRTGVFLGCTGYPECRFTLPCDENGVPLRQMSEEELKRPCEACGQGTLEVKWKRTRSFLGCNRYPKCKNTASLPEGAFVRKPPAPPPEQAGVSCDKCGRAMVIRKSRRGPFLSCSGFPRCRNAKPLDKLHELKAVEAQRGSASPEAVDERESGAVSGPTRRQRGAAEPPAGRNGLDPAGPPPPGFAWTRTGRPVVENLPEGALHCPQCGEVMDLKRGRFGPFYSCTGFPRCRFVANLRGEAKKAAEELLPAPVRPKPIETDIRCEECGKPMLIREGRSGKFLGCSGYPKCRSTKELPAGVVA